MTNIMPPGPLAYEGDVTVPYITRHSNPISSNFQFTVPTLWDNPSENKLWALVSKPQNVAKWILLSSGGTGPAVQFTPTSGIVVTPDSITGNVNVSAGAGITVTGTPETLTIALQGGGSAIETIHTQSGDVTPVGNAITVNGSNASNTSGSGSTLTVNAINTAKWIVDPTAGVGTHTTISAALAAASSGQTVFIRPGSYTENITPKAGVDLATFSSEYLSGQVTINGTCTCNYSGTVSCAGINFQTNGATPAITSSSGTPILNLKDCLTSASTNTGITSTNSSFTISAYDCLFSAGGSNAPWSISSGNMGLNRCSVSSSNSTAANIDAGVINIFQCSLATALSTSTSGSYNLFNSVINTNNATCINTSGTGSSTITNSLLQSGSASAAIIGSGTTLKLSNVTVNSSNTNQLTGAGTLLYTPISFLQGSGLNCNVTTQTPLAEGIITINPSQPVFRVFLTTTQSNVTGDSTSYVIPFDGVSINAGGYYNTSTHVFTAPVTGKYQFACTVNFDGLGAANTQGNIDFSSSVGSAIGFDANVGAMRNANNNLIIFSSAIIPLSATQTCSITVAVFNGTKTVNILGGSNQTRFEGFLIA